MNIIQLIRILCCYIDIYVCYVLQNFCNLSFIYHKYLTISYLFVIYIMQNFFFFFKFIKRHLPYLAFLEAEKFIKGKNIPVDTRRHFNVDTTQCNVVRHCIEVETTQYVNRDTAQHFQTIGVIILVKLSALKDSTSKVLKSELT